MPANPVSCRRISENERPLAFPQIVAGLDQTHRVHVHHLRRKLGANLISTVRGVGYMIPRDGVVRG